MSSTASDAEKRAQPDLETQTKREDPERTAEAEKGGVIDEQDESSTDEPADRAMKPAASTAAARATDWGFLPILPQLRRDREHSATYPLLVVFGLISYYVQSILPEIAAGFNVSYDRVAHLPTLCQGGYAAGILFISPLGDLVSRRKVLLAVVTVSSLLTIGLALTRSFVAFEVLSFAVGSCSVVPQVFLTLTADLAKPEKRARGLSIVFSGLLFGIVVRKRVRSTLITQFARLVSGLIAQYSDWRNTYWMALGLQGGALLVIWTITPDLPPKDNGLTYWSILTTMGRLLYTQPVLVQLCLLAVCVSFTFGSLWATLSFLLKEQFAFSELQIGLFGIAGLAGVIAAPLIGKVVDRLLPWSSILIGLFVYFIANAIQTGAGGINLAAPVLCIIFVDIAMQFVQVASATWFFQVLPQARARANAVYLIAVFAGQAIGSGAGSQVFLDQGWRKSAGLNLGLCGLGLIVLLARGPRAKGWLGWSASYDLRKHRPQPAKDIEQVSDLKPREVEQASDVKPPVIEAKQDVK